MTKIDRLVAIRAQEEIAEHGSMAAAIVALEARIEGFKRESVTEAPIAMRKFYHRVLAHLRTRQANERNIRE